jgi:hypothetical protein
VEKWNKREILSILKIYNAIFIEYTIALCSDMSTDDEILALTGLPARTRSEEIAMAMNNFLNNNYKKFEEFKVRDSEASVWMLMNEPLVVSANMNLKTRETLVDMLHQQIIHGEKEIQTMGATKRPIQGMKRLKSILEERINKTNKAIGYLHSNSQNVNELIQKYSLLQLVELEQMLRHNLLRKRYPPDMIPFVKDVLLPRLRLEIQAKIIDVAVEGRKSEGGFKRSAKKRSKSSRAKKSRRPLK